MLGRWTCWVFVARIRNGVYSGKADPDAEGLVGGEVRTGGRRCVAGILGRNGRGMLERLRNDENKKGNIQEF